MANKTEARVLADLPVGGAVYRPNQVILLSKADIKQFSASGQVDADPAAVEYAKSQGADPIDPEPEPAAEPDPNNPSANPDPNAPPQ